MELELHRSINCPLCCRWKKKETTIERQGEEVKKAVLSSERVK